MAVNIGDIVAKIKADSTDYQAGMRKVVATTKNAMGKVSNIFTAVKKSVFSLQGAIVTAFAGLAVKKIAGDFVAVASSFEDMRIKLDALTQGMGAQTLDKINKWALEMPVNTREAVNTFAMMQAMGLDPTIEKMETLVNVSSLFGEDTMPRVARALGQIAAKGKISAEEINQLSEAGLNVRKYLSEAFDMTVEEIQKAQIPIQEVLDTIWKGLDADYAGAARAAQNSWRGLTVTFRSYIEELEKTVMEAGVFDAMKDGMREVNESFKIWLETNRDLIEVNVPIYIDKIRAAVAFLADVFDVAATAFEGFLWYAKDVGRITGILPLIDAISRLHQLFSDPPKEYSKYLEYIKKNSDRAASSFDNLSEKQADINEKVDAYWQYIKNKAAADKAAADAAKKHAEEQKKLNAELAKAEQKYRDYYAEMEATVQKIADANADAKADMAAAEAEAAIEIAKTQNAMYSSSAATEKATEKTKEGIIAWERYANTVGDNVANGIGRMIQYAESAGDVLKSLAVEIVNIAGQIAQAFAMEAIGSYFASGKGNVIATNPGQSGMVTPGANGMVVNTFASGGLVTRPTVFPMQNGVGLMGEAGPEGIFPLKRDDYGNLGVQAGGGGGDTFVFIQANDANSFEQQLRRNGGTIISIANQDLMSRGSLRSTIRRTM